MTTQGETERPVGLLIIGSGPAGVGAARGYREAGGQGRVVMVSSDTDEPYERPPLSKDELVGPEVAGRTPLLPGPTEDVVLHLGATVTALDLGERTAQLGEEPLTWERLVLAVGMRPRTLPVVEPGAEVHHLRTLEDARHLSRAAQRARTAVVIGSGFIGCEAAASLALRGLDTTLVTPEDGPQLDRLGAFASRALTQWLTELGVELRTGTTVTGLQAPRTVHLDDGTTLAPDLILAAIGVEPATDFLQDSGLQLHEGRVVTDDRLQAGEGVWAAGDCARSHHHLAGRPVDVEHWGDAIAMGSWPGPTRQRTRRGRPSAGGRCRGSGAPSAGTPSSTPPGATGTPTRRSSRGSAASPSGMPMTRTPSSEP